MVNTIRELEQTKTLIVNKKGKVIVMQETVDTKTHIVNDKTINSLGLYIETIGQS